MHFADHEKTIYCPQGSDKPFDPLALDRALTQASNGRLNELLTQWQAGLDGRGDVSPEAKSNDAVLRAEAEGQLAKVARQAFGLPDFPDCCDATALEWLCDFLEWMAGKGTRAGSPRNSTDSSPASRNRPVATANTSP